MASAQTPSPLPTPTSFLSLPAEILAVIILHVDTPTAIALRRVSLHFSTLDINQHLLHDLSLAVSDHEEGISLPNPSVLEIETAKAAEAAISQRLLAKTQAVLALLQLNPKLSSIVHTLTLVPRPSAIPTIVEILKLVSPTLQSLRLLAPQSHPCDSHWRASQKDRLDWALFDSGLTLPSLHSIVFGPRSTQYYPGFINYLCRCAFNLSSVDIDISKPADRYNVPTSKHPRYPYNKFSHQQVKTLQLRRKYPIAGDVCTSMLGRLRHFSNVHSVTIDLEPEPRTMRGLMFVLKGMSHLEALDIRGVSQEEFFSVARMPGGVGFAKLRRLVLGHVDWNSLYQHFRPMPRIEAILFLDLAPSPTNPIFETADAQAMTSTFATALRGSPELRHLHVLDPSTYGRTIPILTSFPRSKDHTDYGGEMVPLRVLDHMRQDEEASEEEWGGRRREIGIMASLALVMWRDPYVE